MEGGYPAARNASLICLSDKRASQVPIHFAWVRGMFLAIYSIRASFK